MTFIVLDLEYNHIDNRNKLLSNTLHLNRPSYMTDEVLQIGAVKLDENLKHISSFKRYIKPQFLVTLNKRVQDLIQIDMNYIKTNGVKFKRAVYEFMNFIGENLKDVVIITWGYSDWIILNKNFEANKIKNINLNDAYYIDLQRVVMNKEGIKIDPSLKGIAEKYNISACRDKYHDAYYDAVITKSILQNIGIDDLYKYNYFISFKKAKDINKSSDESLLKNEVNKEILCDGCRCKAKEIDSIKFYNYNRRDFRMNKLFKCTGCNTYIYKTYIYDKQKKGLMITEKKAECNNMADVDRMLEKFYAIKNIK
ncbi:MAG: hypothetical protein PWP67_2257 [Clostridium butyricum]|nr:hypothetical protein [Clostridium butyricum]